MEVTNDGSVILTCGVESDPNNDLLFTLRKENITLISQRSSLMFNASSFTNPYGLYVCTLERSTKNVTLLLREHGKILQCTYCITGNFGEVFNFVKLAILWSCLCTIKL